MRKSRDIAILLIIPACLLSSCSFLIPEKGKSFAGDSMSRCIENEGGTRWMEIRDESCPDDLVILEWNFGTSSPFCQIAFDRKEWLTRAHSEPKALWVRYDWHGGCLGEPKP